MHATSLQERKEIGAWKSSEMVSRYAHFEPEHLSTAAAEIERQPAIVEHCTALLH